MSTALPDHFWAKVDFAGDCWIWTGARSKGYGHFTLAMKSFLAHRLVYEDLVGPIPDGLQIDHLCRVKACVNPDHLEPVTPLENTRRGSTGAVNSARRRAITRCAQGHEFDEANTYINSRGARCCRKCRAALARRRRHRVAAD